MIIDYTTLSKFIRVLSKQITNNFQTMKRALTHPNNRKARSAVLQLSLRQQSNWDGNFSRIWMLSKQTLSKLLFCILFCGLSFIATAQSVDTDGDGISDNTEINNNTDPNDPCDPNENAGSCCTYQGTTIDFNALEGNIDEDHQTIFLLTLPSGEIVNFDTLSVFTAVNPDLYYLYAVNYRTQDGITGVELGENIANVSSECMDISAPFIIQNCSNVVQIAAKAFLQGGFEMNEGLMRDDLRVSGHIPTIEPYRTQPNFEHVNNSRNESIDESIFTKTGNNAIVDWVFLELRDANRPDSVVATRSALVQRDGDIVDLDGISTVEFNQEVGTYYVAVRHRNHLGVMTLEAHTMTKDPFVVDFTNIETPTWGTHAQKLEGGVARMWGGNTTIDDFLIFQGAANDVDPVFFNVILSEDNGNSVTNYIVDGYLSSDTDLNGKTIYQGVNNDLDQLIFFNILAHPSNVNTIVNYIVVEQLP